MREDGCGGGLGPRGRKGRGPLSSGEGTSWRGSTLSTSFHLEDQKSGGEDKVHAVDVWGPGFEDKAK